MGNGIMSDMGFEPPIWLKGVIWTAKEIGFPFIMIGVMMAVLFGWAPSPMLSQHEELLNRQASIHGVLGANQDLIVESSDQLSELIYVNRAVCVNNAKTNSQRERCLREHD